MSHSERIMGPQQATTGIPEEAGPDGEAAAPRRVRKLPERGALFVVLIALCVIFSIGSPNFLNWNNWLNILTDVAVMGIIAAPATLLLVAGQFDLSVGSGAALCGVFFATFAAHLGSDLWAVILTVLIGLVLGAVNGFFVSVVGVNSLITTLGTLAAFSGLAEIIAKGQTVVLSGFTTLGSGRVIFRIPIPVIVLIVVLFLFWLAMRYTVYGRTMYAIGSNQLAARLSGLRLRRAIFIGFILSGLAVALGGMILTSQLSAASPIAAQGLELSVVTAVVLGGASLSGGRGSIVGTALGLVILGVLSDGLILLNVGTFWQNVASGSLLILAVSIDRIGQRFKKA